MMVSKSRKTKSRRTSDFSMLDTPAQHHAMAMRQLGIQSEKKLKYLHDVLEKHSMSIKLRKGANNDIKSNIKSNEVWKIPYKIIAFIQNRILQLEENRRIMEKYELMEWHQFKEVIFAIYDHRIKHAPELNGGANSSYCALNEHMIMYFVDEYKHRARAEEKIVDLLINLRYWYDIWPRARTYA